MHSSLDERIIYPRLSPSEELFIPVCPPVKASVSAIASFDVVLTYARSIIKRILQL